MDGFSLTRCTSYVVCEVSGAGLVWVRALQAVLKITSTEEA